MIRRVVVLTGIFSAMLVGVVGAHHTAYAAGANCTWTGASNTFWSNAANWSGCGGQAPQDDDNLIFDTTPLTNSSDGFLTNDMSSLQVGSITFSGSNIYGYHIGGNGISLANGITSTANNINSLSVDITLTASQSVTASSGSLVNFGDTSLDMGAYTLTISGAGRTEIWAAVVGTGTLKYSGTSHAFAFLHENSPNFSGTVLVQNSSRLIINAAQPTVLGTAAVVISDGGILQESFNTASSYTLSNAITLVGDGGGNNGAINLHDFTGGTSTLTFSGTITLTGNTQIDLDNANAIFLSRPSGCGYSISKSSGSSGSGGSLTGNLVGSCPTSATSGYSWTEQTASLSGDWQMIASSGDGSRLISAIYNGHIYTSSDYGATWVDRAGAGTHNWVGVASSADGRYLAAGDYGGHIHTSADYGVSWVDRTAIGNGNWQGIAMSSDGSRLATVSFGGDVFTSSDYGATWTDRTTAGTRDWSTVASSADGSRLAAVVYGGDIYTSSDYGATWTDRTAAGSRIWNFAVSSADGSHLAATVYGGHIYTSDNYGVTWTDRTSAGYANWQGIAMSSNGSHLVALESGGDIWTSADYGATWLDPPGKHQWYGVTMSASGARIAATVSPGHIWTAYDPSLDPVSTIAQALRSPSTGFGTPQPTQASARNMAAVSLTLLGSGLFLLFQNNIHRKRKNYDTCAGNSH